MFFDHLPEHGVICAHRGARSIAPENTMLALEKAKGCGAHCWETDVRVSKDGELIIFHDETLERTTNIKTHQDFKNRQTWRADQYTADELCELDGGSWFLEKDPFGTVASGAVAPEDRESISSQKIPLLREILEFTKKHSFPVNVEIKDLKTPPGETSIVDSIMDMLRETDTTDLVLLSSFRHEYLRRARELSKDIALGVLTDKQHPPNLIQYLHSMSAGVYHPEQSSCDLALLRHLQQAGLRVNIWTINDMKTAQKMFDAGAGVITDWPQRMT